MNHTLAFTHTYPARASSYEMASREKDALSNALLDSSLPPGQRLTLDSRSLGESRLPRLVSSQKKKSRQFLDEMPVLKSVLSLFSASNVSIAEADSRSSIATNIQPLPVTLLANGEIDHTCNVRMDYGTGNRCPGIQDGKCDNPNYGEGSEECRGQDCIDCNYYCKQGMEVLDQSLSL